MATFTFSNLDQWALKTNKRLTAVVRHATSKTLSEIEIVPGIMRGGSPQRGQIPRHLGFLANSLTSSLYGSTSAGNSGEDSYVNVIGGMKPGDTATFVWGAVYARAIHYGRDGVGGTFWVDVAATKWSRNVSDSVRLAKAQVG